MFSRRMVLAGGAALSLASPLRGSPASTGRLGRFASEHRFSGIVAQASGGRLHDIFMAGLADREKDLPIGPSTSFRIGSITKWLTAIAVLRLAERGRMSLRAPIGRYLPELGKAFAAVPLDYLLANNSGIPDLVGRAAGADPSFRASTAGSAEIVRRFASGTLVFAPGERFDYSFFNWVLVHAAIERVTGRPFEAIIANEVLRPARLTQAGFIDTAHPTAPGVAQAYAADGALKLGLVPPFGGASGNVHATAADLASLAHHVFAGRVLRRSSLAELTRIRVPEENYALGGRMRVLGGRNTAWQTGKVGAYRAHLAHDIAADRTVVILTNSDLEQSVIGRLAEELLIPPQG